MVSYDYLEIMSKAKGVHKLTLEKYIPVYDPCVI